MKQNPRTAVATHPAREKKRLILVSVGLQERLSRAEEATILQGEKRAGIRPVGCFVVHRVFGGRPNHNPGQSNTRCPQKSRFLSLLPGA
jgi:hypothetical protein